MCPVKKILIIILSLLILSSPALANLCLTIEILSLQTCENLYFKDPEQSHHAESSCNNKNPCPNNYSCCHLATVSIISYAFLLDSHYLDSGKIFIPLFETTKPFYRPPRTQPV